MNLEIDPLDPLKREIEKEARRKKALNSNILRYNFPRSFEIFRIEGIKFYKVSRE